MRDRAALEQRVVAFDMGAEPPLFVATDGELLLLGIPLKRIGMLTPDGQGVTLPAEHQHLTLWHADPGAPLRVADDPRAPRTQAKEVATPCAGYEDQQKRSERGHVHDGSLREPRWGQGLVAQV